jgi:hypothetical protein
MKSILTMILQIVLVFLSFVGIFFIMQWTVATFPSVEAQSLVFGALVPVELFLLCFVIQRF